MVLFSITVNEGWPLYQVDVKNSFLHGELKEEIYMENPLRFTDEFRSREVCGLKKSPQAWFGSFTLEIK